MTENYAPLMNRIKAAAIDGIIIIALMYAFTEIFRQFDEVPENIRMIAFLFVFFLYEPLFVSAFGGTIGHTYSNIKVKREHNTLKNISFPIAIMRFVLKSLLGWISLLTVTGNAKRQAIHDYAAKSIVLTDK